MVFLNRIIFILFFFFFLRVKAQVCGFDSLLNHHPELKNEWNKNFITKNKTEVEIPKVTYVIPVVFHILYENERQNLPDSVILNQLNILNQLFYQCDEEIRDVFKPIVGCANIKFELAELDPNGNPTSGIVRKQTEEKTFYHSEAIFIFDNPKYERFGGTPAWNTDAYLNIWICNLRPTSGAGGLLGYAFPPVGSPMWNQAFYVAKERQGVVMHFETIGENNPFGNKRWSRVLAHEIGHFLGLKHPWGDNEGDCDMNDFIDDTPPCKNPSHLCNFNKNTCHEEPIDLPDMIENIMDYSPSACLTHFTQGQVNRMLHNLIQFRPKLYHIKTEDSTFIGLYVRPNPNNGKFNLAIGKKLGESNRYLEIFDVSGKLLHTQSIPDEVSIYEFDLRPLPRGIYFVWLHSLQYSFYTKMMVY